MKTYILLSVLCIFILNTQGQTPPQGFVTLKGRQFYDGNGLPFYPLLMNYSLEYQHDNAQNGTHWLNKSWEYGTDDDGFETNNFLAAQIEIMNDLHQIKLMGFNMVRPDFTAEWDTDVNQFYLKGRTYGNPNNPADPNNHSSQERRIWFDQPSLATDPNFIEYLDYLDWFISMAGNENMYTMLNGALGDVSDPLAYNRYLEFLDLLGKRFKDNKWLAFYDILNEPLYKYKYAHADGDINFYTKKQACELVEDFYNALKNPNADPNHLVSGGNLVTEDVILFDPSLMKLDFSQPHLYSEKFISYDGMNLTNKINRVNGSTYWVYKNIPMPWINGETGFPSSDVFPIGVNLVAGTNQDQKTYADNILSSTRDHGGSGFTWWNFQDGAWEEYGTEIFGYGLLILESGIDKPAVNSFQSYLDPSTNQPPPMSTIVPSEPPNFRDPYVNKLYNPNETGAVTGTVLDENGNGIENAWIVAKNYLKINQTTGYADCSWIYTYTKNNGNFKLIPFNNEPTNDHRITYLIGSAMGVESFHSGINDGTQMANPPPFTLKQIKFEYDAIVESDVPISEEINFKGWNSLTMNNSKLEGISTLNAREVINLHDGFHATQTSEVHIFPAETFAVCNDYTDYTIHLQRESQTNHSNSNIVDTKNIEIKFSKAKISMFIQPNPTTGCVTVKLTNDENLDNKKLIVRNMIGENLKEIIFIGNETVFNLTNLPKGIYLIEMNSDQKQLISKLILN